MHPAEPPPGLLWSRMKSLRAMADVCAGLENLRSQGFYLVDVGYIDISCFPDETRPEGVKAQVTSTFGGVRRVLPDKEWSLYEYTVDDDAEDSERPERSGHPVHSSTVDGKLREGAYLPESATYDVAIIIFNKVAEKDGPDCTIARTGGVGEEGAV